MPHHTPLIATIAIGLGFAFLLGLLAQRVKLPPIVGYLLAGVIVGPFTPGFVADQKLAVELAEIGVILLMFGVGLHFSIRDLASVRAIAIPGAIGQISVATFLGVALAYALGWGLGAGLVFGLSLSVASTVVLLRALQEQRQVETEKGRIAIGWLIVEDIAMVLALVLVPSMAGWLGGTEYQFNDTFGLQNLLGVNAVLAALIATGVKISLFVVMMLLIGRKLIPHLLHYVAHTGSRELFRLSVLVIALGIAYGSASLFGVSFALGAFFAGMVLAESPLSHQAAKDTLPLRDAFAVLFFVSVGMLLDPKILITQPLAVLATFTVIVFGKSLVAYWIVRAFRYSREVALTIAASLAQIGEFSFILIVLGVNLDIVPPMARDLVVAGSILSILVNPMIFFAIHRMLPKDPGEASTAAVLKPSAQTTTRPVTEAKGHIVLVGHGRVGRTISAALRAKGAPFIVVDESELNLEDLKEHGIKTLTGECGEEAMMEQLRLSEAKALALAIPDAFEAGHIVEAARLANPQLYIVSRAQNADGVEHLKKLGADTVLIGEEELGKNMARMISARA